MSDDYDYWLDLTGNEKQNKKTRYNKVMDKISKGGGGGGTTDYNALSNHPDIENCELKGHLKLEDIGIKIAKDINPDKDNLITFEVLENYIAKVLEELDIHRTKKLGDYLYEKTYIKEDLDYAGAKEHFEKTK